MKCVVLNNGVKMPVIGYGTYQIPVEITEECVEKALQVGYRLIDTAQCYGNEAAVGSACRKSGLPREEIFITTKLWGCRGYQDTLRAIDESMRKINMDYIDLMLIHEPTGDVYEIYRAMEAAYAAGKLRSIGVANFLYDRYLDLVNHCKVIPAVNQVENHVFRQQKRLRNLEKQLGTIPEAWSPLACGKNGIFTNRILLEIAEGYGKSAAQIALRFLYEMGVVVIPKSTKRDHMAENINIFDFELTTDELKKIKALEVGKSFFSWW